jgi:sec-independent protein translocase protein TatA
MFGLQEWIIPIGILVLILIFGGRKFGEIGTGLGEGIRNFKKAVKGEDSKQGSGENPEGPRKG